MNDMEKWELAYKDYQNGMKYKEIAEKYDVSINTVKSWKSRKWNEGATKDKKVAHKNKKGCTQKKVQPVIDNDELTEQQKMFCLFYLQHFNATKAYQQAYGCDYNTANANGSRMLVNASIKQELHRLKAELQSDVFVTAKDLIQEYIKQVFADMNDYTLFGTEMIECEDGEERPFSFVRLKDSAEVDGTLIQEVKKGKDGVSVKLYDKQKAMSELMKYLGADELRRAQIEKAKAEIEKIRLSATADQTTEDKLSELLDKISEGIDDVS